jgi:hypothetical protein
MRSTPLSLDHMLDHEAQQPHRICLTLPLGQVRLAGYEPLQMIVAAGEPLSIESGCLTPAMKIEPNRIEAVIGPQMQARYFGRTEVLWA